MHLEIVIKKFLKFRTFIFKTISYWCLPFPKGYENAIKKINPIIASFRERIMSLEASQGTDRVNNYLQALNITLEISRPEQEQELLQLVLRMVKDLENKRTRKNPPLCRNVDQYKIQPGDSKPEVQRKQGEN